MKQIPEDILTKALELREAGRTPEQIFAVFPEAAGELKQYFNLVADLRAEAKRIAPPSREVLRGALRRAAVMRGISDISVKPASASFFARVPFGLRLLAPVLAVIVITVFIDGSRVMAPEPILTGNDAALQDLAATESSETSLARFSTPEGPTVPPTAMMTAKSSGTGTEYTTPSDEADRIAQAYVTNAESEDAVLSDTSAEDEAAQADESQSAQYVAEPIN